jgi:hypothetical protein
MSTDFGGIMNLIEEILHSKMRPKEKQTRLVKAVLCAEIPAQQFFEFFAAASDTDRGSCADIMKHVSEQKPELLAPYLDLLIDYIHDRAPRVKWGVQEAIGNLARLYPDKAEKAIPFLMQNTLENEVNTTVVRWCAAYALTEIAKYNPQAREQLLAFFGDILLVEKNTGVKNVYLQAIKTIQKQKLSMLKPK